MKLNIQSSATLGVAAPLLLVMGAIGLAAGSPKMLAPDCLVTQTGVCLTQAACSSRGSGYSCRSSSTSPCECQPPAGKQLRLRLDFPSSSSSGKASPALPAQPGQ
jgi:hypothetical protein